MSLRWSYALGLGAGVLLVACSDGGGASLLHVSVGARATIAGVDALLATAARDRDVASARFGLPGGLAELPPPVSLNLRLDDGVAGTVVVRVDALDGSGRLLARGEAAARAAAGEVANVTVLLDAVSPPVGDGGPGGAAPDLAPACATATCGGRCTDLTHDPASCGACGHGCPEAGLACVKGGCAWLTELYRAGSEVASNVVVGGDGTAYFVGTAGADLEAVDPNGAPLWTRPVGKPGARAYVALDDAHQRLFVASPALSVWRTDGTRLAAGKVQAGALAITVAGDVYSGDRQGGTAHMALSSPGGALLWSAPFPGDPADVAIGADGTLYAHGIDALAPDAPIVVAALSPKDGAVAWKRVTTPKSGTSYAPSGLLATASEVVSSERHALSVVELDGTLRFRKELVETVCAPVVDTEGSLVVVLRGGGDDLVVVGLRRSDGAELWRATKAGALAGDPACHTPTVGIDGVLYVHAGHDAAAGGLGVHVLHDHKLIQSQPGYFDPVGLDPYPLSPLGLSLVVESDGRVHALQTSSYGGLGKTPWPSGYGDAAGTHRAGP